MNIHNFEIITFELARTMGNIFFITLISIIIISVIVFIILSIICLINCCLENDEVIGKTKKSGSLCATRYY